MFDTLVLADHVFELHPFVGVFNGHGMHGFCGTYCLGRDGGCAQIGEVGKLPATQREHHVVTYDHIVEGDETHWLGEIHLRLSLDGDLILADCGQIKLSLHPYGDHEIVR